ncbi:MAG: Calx-beta domain-containing protein [Ilumatobacter sp.]
MGKKWTAALCAALGATVLIGVPGTPAGAVPDGFEADNVITGLDRPTNMEFSPDGRLFIAEQGGLLKVFDSIDDATPDIVADLRDQVHSVNGRGLLGLALDPDFPAVSDVYVMYSMDAPIGGETPTYGVPGAANDECAIPGTCVIGGRISRLALDGNTATSETVILEDWCQEWTSHSVGDLRFGPEGALYATAGDGAFAGQPDWGQKSGRNGCGDPPSPHGGEDQDPSNAEGGALRSQDLRTSGDPATLAGSLIRIDKNTGEAFPDNPNFGDPDPNVARIIAYGLRNPYRTTFRPGTNELWIGDVGWNDWEEINVVSQPDDVVENFGWPCLEGPDVGYDIGADICTDLLDEGPLATKAPYWAYKQRESFADDLGCFNNNGSPSAFAFYEGGSYPEEYDGAFFFGDYSRRCVWEMAPSEHGRPDPSTARLVLSDIAVTDLAVGPAGDIFMLNIFGGGGLGGTVVRLTYPDGVAEPIARLTASPTTGPTPLFVELDASASAPGVPGEVLSYEWDLDGDGEFDDGVGAVVQTTYTEEGRFNPQVRVTDGTGSDLASTTLIVGTPPTVTITEPVADTSWVVDDVLSFAGSAVDTAGDPIPIEDLSWDLILHHCETLDDCHTHTIGTVGGVDSGTFLAPEHEYPSYIEVKLSATSSAGLVGSNFVEMYPETTFLTVDSAPQGLEVGVNGKPFTTPSVHEVIVGTGNTVSAPEQQFVAPRTYLFDGWSDGGARIHDVTVNDELTVTATHEILEVPTLLPGDVSVPEGTGGRTRVEVPITLSSPATKTVSVTATLTAGTATIGSDVVRWSPRIVRFLPGQTEKTVLVDVINDNLDEVDEEQFTIEYSGASNAPLGATTSTVTIVDDDATPVLVLADKRVTEGNGTGTKNVTLALRLSGPSDRPIVVDFETDDGSAVAGADYQAIAPTAVTFAPRATFRTLTVRTFRDDIAESDESFFLRLLGADNADVVDDDLKITIVDDEPSLTIRDATVSEGASGERRLRFTVRSSRTARTPITVNWSTLDQSAESGVDHAGGSGSVVIPSGKNTAVIQLVVYGDTTPEPDETLLMLIDSADGASIDDGEAVGTIRSDDYRPIVNIDDASKVEAWTTVRVPVTLDGAGATAVIVYATTVDGTATAGEDYVALNRARVYFGRGVVSRTVAVKLRGDRIAEGDETLTVVLTDASGAEIGRSESVVTIVDND